MGKFRYDAADGCDSEHEEADGTIYKPLCYIDSGVYDTARLFFAPKAQNKKPKVVLNPKYLFDDSLKRAQIKQDFFKALYPQEEVLLFKCPDSDEYRLILPLIPGKTYDDFIRKYSLTQEGKVKILLSAIEALLYCHSKNYVFIDFNFGNILYDFNSGKSFLIDGDMARPIGNPISPLIINASALKYPQFAPECSQKTSPVLADTAMDVFTLAFNFQHILSDPHVSKILENCRCEKSKRLTLNQLKARLLPLLGTGKDLRLKPYDFVERQDHLFIPKCFQRNLSFFDKYEKSISFASKAGIATGILGSAVLSSLIAVGGIIPTFGFGIILIIPVVITAALVITGSSGFVAGLVASLISEFLELVKESPSNNQQNLSL
jgi:hypothetical protein